MTKAEIIAALESLPSDLPIVIPGTGCSETGYVSLQTISILELWVQDGYPNHFEAGRQAIDAKLKKAIVIE